MCECMRVCYIERERGKQWKTVKEMVGSRGTGQERERVGKGKGRKRG